MQFGIALRTINKFSLGLIALVSLTLVACGGGGSSTPPSNPATFSIGGSASGLTGTVVLQNNGTDNLSLSANGTFTFATQITSGNTYNVTILTQPVGQTCRVSAGNGTATSNITNVAIFCSAPLYSVGGTVSGLSGSVVLQNNGGDNLTVSASGNFAFPTQHVNGSAYHVTVLTQPVGQTCSVSTGAGTVSGANIASVAVVCSANTYSVGGMIAGLTGTVVLQNNAGSNLTVSANGSFTFTNPVASGSPYAITILTQPANQNCSVANGTGTIATSNVNNVTITCGSNANTVGGTIAGLTGSVVLQNNGADNLTAAVNGNFTFANTIAYGSAFNVTVLTQPSGQTCNVTGGNGTVSVNVSSVVVSCAKNTTPKFAYVIQGNGYNSVTPYSINASTGALTLLQSVPTGFDPQLATIDPSGKYLYAPSQASNYISAYAINSNTGALTSIGATVVVAGSGPSSVAVDPSSKFAYVANWYSNTVSQYTIDASGMLIPMTPATIAAGKNPFSLTVDPSGKYVYVANESSNDVSAFSINPNTGVLTSLGATIPAGKFPLFVRVDPSGKYVYVVNQNSTDVSAYAINPSNGTLTSVGTTAPTGLGYAPCSVTIDPSGKFAYVPNCSSGSISAYTINPNTGALTSMGTLVSAGMFPHSVAIDPSGKFAYATNYGSWDISAYTINSSTGVLTSIGTTSVMYPVAITITP